MGRWGAQTHGNWVKKHVKFSLRSHNKQVVFTASSSAQHQNELKFHVLVPDS